MRKSCASPGAERLKVDVIEAGFAIASPGDFAAVKLVADNIKDSTVCSLRAVDADIERAAGAGRRQLWRIHTFIATSPIHMQYKLRMQPDGGGAGSARGEEGAQPVRRRGVFLRGRRPLGDRFPLPHHRGCHRRRARTINIPDTVGYAIPHQYADTIRQLLERIPNADKAVFSVHCHNDLGLAVANSLAAVVAGARRGMHYQRPRRACRQRRAGRDRHGDQDPPDLLNVHTRIETEHILAACASVSGITGFRCSRTRPSSAPTPSPTSRASTGTACSSIVRPTRSCPPSRWAGTPTRWLWASTPVAPRSVRARRSWASHWKATS